MTNPSNIPPGFTLVPIHLTPAMTRVMMQDEWDWSELLAEAGRIDEDQYNSSFNGPPDIAKALLQAETLLKEAVDLCAVGDIDEDADDGLGWAGFVRDAKALLLELSMAPGVEPAATPPAEAQAEPKRLAQDRTEAAAKAIFAHYAFQAPAAWVEHGNSDMQQSARSLAFAALAADDAQPPQAQGEALRNAVIEAAGEWWCDRTPDDWNSAELAKAVIRLSGDWPGCPECDFECGEPCTPATVAEQLHAVDCHMAQLVHEGKLHGGDGYAPPDGWKPVVARLRAVPPAPPAVEPSDERVMRGLLQESLAWIANSAEPAPSLCADILKALAKRSQPPPAVEPSAATQGAIDLLHRMLEASGTQISESWKAAIRPTLAGLITATEAAPLSRDAIRWRFVGRYDNDFGVLRLSAGGAWVHVTLAEIDAAIDAATRSGPQPTDAQRAEYERLQEAAFAAGRARVAPAQAAGDVPTDTQMIDWLSRAGDVSFGLVVDAPRDGEMALHADGCSSAYGATLRDAIRAAMAIELNRNAKTGD